MGFIKLITGILCCMAGFAAAGFVFYAEVILRFVHWNWNFDFIDLVALAFFVGGLVLLWGGYHAVMHWNEYEPSDNIYD